MELIKQIKDAENQAKEIVEKARKDAVARMEQVRIDHDGHLRKAQKNREEALVIAVAQAQEQTQSQVQELVDQGHKKIEAVAQASGGKMESCIAAIVARLEQA
jgi:vacuolar-type H+-ATPase subunit H